MAVLVIAEVVDGVLATALVGKAVAAVATLGEVHLVVAGPRAAAEAAARIAGVAKVLLAEGEAYDHGLPEPTADLIVSLASGYDHVAAASSSFSKSVLPRAAALLDVMVISDVVAVLDAETFVRPIYAGNALQTVRSGDAIKVFTIRPAAFTAAEDTDSQAPVETIVAATPGPPLSRWVQDRMASSDRPDLISARVVVSGGRGVGSRENFALVEELADKLGAAVGASRAAVDAGYAANDLQVGQTGKVVAPDLYIAIGISGAIQHVAGMKDAKVIVAINKDPEAPIFQIADYALVGDLFTILPELDRALS